jgi:hypothetical protein
MPVYAAIAVGRFGYYSRRERKGKSERRFPGVRSRRGMGGTAAAVAVASRVRLKPDTTYIKKADLKVRLYDRLRGGP